MSKCNIEIRFDRPTAVYAAGEEVTGSILVAVNQDVNCKGIVIEHYWRTHGRGNSATGAKEQQTVTPGQLRRGDTWSDKFSFLAPDGPPSYHGHDLNVEHYIHVRVDIPWAFDPQASAEYVLATGKNYLSGAAAGPNASAKTTFEQHGFKIAVGMLIAGVICIFPFGIVLIPASLVMIYFALRKSFAEKKLGPVELTVPGREVVAGSEIPFALAFSPRKNSRVRRITVQLLGQEVCVSGSGTNKTTHVHKLHEELIELSGPREFTAGQGVQLSHLFVLPPMPAYSFAAPDNMVQWQLTVRFDLPGWPDWVDTIPLVVVADGTLVPPLPHTAVEDADEDADEDAGDPDLVETEYGMSGGRDEGRDYGHGDGPNYGEEDFDGSYDDHPQATSAAEGVEVGSPVWGTELPQRDLVSLLQRISHAGRFGSAREDLVTEYLDTSFHLELEIDDNARTYGSFFDDRYRDGRTLRGRVGGTELFVEVQCLAERNAELQDLRRGQQVDLVAAPHRWDHTFDRLAMREV